MQKILLNFLLPFIALQAQAQSVAELMVAAENIPVILNRESGIYLLQDYPNEDDDFRFTEREYSPFYDQMKPGRAVMEILNELFDTDKFIGLSGPTNLNMPVEGASDLWLDLKIRLVYSYIDYPTQSHDLYRIKAFVDLSFYYQANQDRRLLELVPLVSKKLFGKMVGQDLKTLERFQASYPADEFLSQLIAVSKTKIPKKLSSILRSYQNRDL